LDQEQAAVLAACRKEAAAAGWRLATQDRTLNLRQQPSAVIAREGWLG
jgi:hypothetical protein